MLSPETIDRLQAGAVATKASDLDTNTPAVILMDGPGKTSVHSIEHLMGGRARFRGVMSTSSLKDFVAYVMSREVSPRGFVDAEKIESLACKAFFNLGHETLPGHADDVAVLKPKMLSAFSVMRSTNGKKLGQQDLIDWIEDWHHILTAHKADGSHMEITAAVAGVRNIKLQKKAEATSTVGNANSARSAFEEIEANRDGTMPGTFTLKTAPFDGFAEKEFVLRVSVLTGSDVPQLSLRWQRQEVQCEEIAQEFKSILVREMGGMADSLVVGTFDAGK